MMLERYKIKASHDLMIFGFTSIGPKGNISKVVQYTEIYPDIYNLGFGDKDELTGEINDRVTTDNGDSKKVLATVAFTIYEFTDKFPGAWVFATGSTPGRTRLYRIGITNFLNEISIDFEVYGLRNEKIEQFETGTNYEGFFVKRKINKFV